MRSARGAWLLRVAWLLGLPGWVLCAASAEAGTALPRRVREIVIHVPGGPSYANPDRRFRFFDPQQTQALWKPRFGAHWIVWTDGSLWPRHPAEGEARSRALPPVDAAGELVRLAREAAPAYSHVYGHNAGTLGIELSHSGRSSDAFPEPQIKSLAWLLRTLLKMSEGRLTPADIVGHKDLDRRPAYANPACESAGCPVFVDEALRPYRRRVDPPESLFVRLRQEGIEVPRPVGAGADAELLRAEALEPGFRPLVRER